MSNKIVVFLSTIFPAKKPVLSVEHYIAPIMGSQISKQPEREPDDYSFMFTGF
jgi:hypothetical protein